MIKDIIVFSLSSNNELADKVCEQLGIKKGQSEVIRFKDGEILATPRCDVRGKKIYIIQSTCPPVNDRLMEVLIFIDGLKRANCKEITLITPYFGYARQDRIAHQNEPITAKMVADMICNAGVTRVIAIELHTMQIQGFFSCPIDNLASSYVFAEALKEIFKGKKGVKGNISLVAPDHGAIYRTRDLGKYFDNTSLVVIDKRRPKPNVAEITNIIGDIEDKICIMVDDIIDTGGTICAGAHALKEKGAKEVYICCSHALFSDGIYDKFENNKDIDMLITTDTITHDEFKKLKKIKVVSVAKMLAEVIKNHESHIAIDDMYSRFH